jgi:uncharacterized protein YjbJ (UPF0337 family)
MQDDVLRNWKHLRGEVRSIWASVTADDLDRVDGRRHKLVNLLEHRYGLARTRAEREVDMLLTALDDRLRKAS